MNDFDKLRDKFTSSEKFFSKLPCGSLFCLTKIFFNFEAYFRTLTHSLKMQLGKIYFSKQLIHYFSETLLSFVSFSPFCGSILISIFKLL